MKKLIYSLLFFASFAGIKYAYGQTDEKISIPVLKESKAIDSLMDIILDSNRKSDRHDSIPPLQDSVIILHIVKKDSSLIFVIRTETQKNINAMFNYPQQGKISFGYFKYKRTNVFVADFDIVSTIFLKKQDFETLKFVYKLKESSFDLPDGLSPKGSRAWTFEFKNGHFSRWVIKESQLLENEE